jgi:hypothetical protein
MLGLLAGLLAGCTSGSAVKSTSWLDRFRKGTVLQGPDVVVLEVALIQRPVGDRYLNAELWETADEQVIALESRAQLEDNGFRIGQIGGIMPAGLQTLLTSERSCANPRRLQLHSGKTRQLVLGPEAPECRFELYGEGEAVPHYFERTQCSLEVVPTLSADGRTSLRFIPQVHHGETKLLPRPAPDRSDWMLTQDRPVERFPQLAWEVSLAPGGNEFVLVGARFDRPETLGHRCFIRGDESSPVQRLLVIRASRSGAAVAGMPDDESPLPPNAPLASQAAYSAVRGAAP